MIRALFCVLLLLPVVAMFASSGDPVERLAAVNVFAIGGVGFAGTISPGENDLLAILGRPTAESDFEKLMSSGNPQAQSYALLGLHRLGSSKFASYAAPLRASKQNVTTIHGCIMGQQTMASMIQDLEHGFYAH